MANLEGGLSRLYRLVDKWNGQIDDATSYQSSGLHQDAWEQLQAVEGEVREFFDHLAHDDDGLFVDSSMVVPARRMGWHCMGLCGPAKVTYQQQGKEQGSVFTESEEALELVTALCRRLNEDDIIQDIRYLNLELDIENAELERRGTAFETQKLDDVKVDICHTPTPNASTMASTAQTGRLIDIAAPSPTATDASPLHLPQAPEIDSGGEGGEGGEPHPLLVELKSMVAEVNQYVDDEKVTMAYYHLQRLKSKTAKILKKERDGFSFPGVGPHPEQRRGSHYRKTGTSLLAGFSYDNLDAAHAHANATAADASQAHAAPAEAPLQMGDSDDRLKAPVYRRPTHTEDRAAVNRYPTEESIQMSSSRPSLVMTHADDGHRSARVRRQALNDHLQRLVGVSIDDMRLRKLNLQFRKVESVAAMINRNLSKDPSWTFERHRAYDFWWRMNDDGTAVIKIEGVLHEPLFNILCLVYEADLHSKWVPFLGSSDFVCNPTRFSEIVLHSYSLPWPLNHREGVVYGFGVDALDDPTYGCCMVVAWSVPDESTMFLGSKVPPVQKGTIRMVVEHFAYFLYPEDDKNTRVRCILKIDPKVKFLPLAIQAYLTRTICSWMWVNISKCSKNFKGSQWERRIAKRPEVYSFIENRLKTYLGGKNK
ncbi:unnamed protein product [Vitrella brassicaformis CCMP3155]|uniref:START domain-containing protein n=1 Tax=Vitrella brassicaformis (strain CCMP3155) TaxID=1169540 RepID=A0A0G4EVQ8_VITBC|nr:unnamed protein product [Vitrella brassicaformis CCMP3155]|eukprot:CEM02389.1 unnamed protein product [Vitrella brassicaformis CCMP3155]